jgi:hypothetical protein
MRVLVFISALLLFGCTKPQQKAEPPVVIQPCILDKALQRAEFAEAIKQAERDLPDDKWRDKPWRMNESRDRREFAVATNILATVEPKFSQMSVTELVHALKISPRLAPEDFGGVAGYVYEIGNAEIIKQIQSRPKDELSVLPSLADDKVEVYEGPQGPGDTLGDLIHWRILKDR